jgi:ABC-2 type transport system permease protein
VRSTAGAGLRAFEAAARKEWRTVRRYPANLAFVVFWPLMLPAVYVLEARGFAGGEPVALRAFAARAGTAEVAGFLYVGWAVFMWLTIVLWGPGASLREEQLRGSLESLFLTPSPRWGILFGSAPAHLAVAMAMLLTVGLTLRLGFGLPVGPATALRALVVVAASVPVLFGTGALLASLVLWLHDASGLFMLLRGLFTVLCGVTYPVAVLPEWAQATAAALPPTHVIDALRAALLGGARLAQLRGSIAVLAALGVALCAAAVLVLGRVERHTRRGKGLGWY